MARLSKAFIWLWIAGAAYAAFAQLFLARLGARGSVWGYTPGWQREIGFWNVGLIALLVAVVRIADQRLLRAAVGALVLLSLLFGTNHALEAFRGWHFHSELFSHVGGMAENYLAVLLGGFVLVFSGARSSLRSRHDRFCTGSSASRP
jgi:hypothetical protein